MLESVLTYNCLGIGNTTSTAAVFLNQLWDIEDIVPAKEGVT